MQVSGLARATLNSCRQTKFIVRTIRPHHKPEHQLTTSCFHWCPTTVLWMALEPLFYNQKLQWIFTRLLFRRHGRTGVSTESYMGRITKMVCHLRTALLHLHAGTAVTLSVLPPLRLRAGSKLFRQKNRVVMRTGVSLTYTCHWEHAESREQRRMVWRRWYLGHRICWRSPETWPRRCDMSQPAAAAAAAAAVWASPARDDNNSSRRELTDVNTVDMTSVRRPSIAPTPSRNSPPASRNLHDRSHVLSHCPHR